MCPAFRPAPVGFCALKVLQYWSASPTGNFLSRSTSFALDPAPYENTVRTVPDDDVAALVAELIFEQLNLVTAVHLIMTAVASAAGRSLLRRFGGRPSSQSMDREKCAESGWPAPSFDLGRCVRCDSHAKGQQESERKLEEPADDGAEKLMALRPAQVSRADGNKQCQAEAD